MAGRGYWGQETWRDDNWHRAFRESLSRTKRYANDTLFYPYNSIQAAHELYCEAVLDEPAPIAFHLDMYIESSAAPSFSPAQQIRVRRPIGIPTALTQWPTVVYLGVEIEYGFGAVRHRIRADMKPGTYQIPPSDLVRVFLIGYTPNGVGSLSVGDECIVSMSLCKGIVSNPSRFTVTGGVQLASGASSSEFTAPDHSRWVDCWATASGIAAGYPIVVLAGSPGDESGVPAVYRNYATGMWAPPYGPVELASNYFGLSQFTLRNDSAAQIEAWCQFYLEL